MPKVASYCTIFLKPEMLHIYRQITGLQRYETVVLAKTRQQEETFPFEAIRLLPAPRKNLVKRFLSKYIRKEASIFYRGEAAVLENVLQTEKVDLLHIYFGHTGVHLLPFLEKTSLPWIVSFHGADVMPREDRPGYLENLKRMLHVIPLVLARSESLAARLRELGCAPEKIRISRTGIPMGEFSQVDRSSRSNLPVRFIQACRLIEKKGLRTTISAFALVRKRLPESSLIIAGEGPLKDELSAQVAQLGLATYVSFVGFLDQKALCEIYGVCDVFVHPSETTPTLDQEGIPNSMLEAMATGLPVVATRHGGIPEAVENGKTGLLVAERDVTALAEALFELGKDEKLRLQMGAAAAVSVRENFDQSIQIARLESFYDELLGLRERFPLCSQAKRL